MVQINSSMLLKTFGIMSAGIDCSAATVSNSLLLAEVAQQLSLPASTWSASGTHTAKGYTSKSAETASVEGLKQDCDNINLNKKLAIDFRSDVFGPGVTGFFYKCEKVSNDTNNYWFTISAGEKTQIDKICNPGTTYPIVHDQQHDTWFIDEPFDCIRQTNPTDFV
ncbi:uncharacterized protein N7479_009324 [Penicillium vulpinum]|uniref:Uncharacterized protein n=1 Tax=Penicillium vulpinum TaxID=29845 RepID=A0A1V6RUU2_9EURO|nr:uncharacterized protein N7479_009324 [Penicillium vulpinum]KAJ5950911.1 hypothetical protein N7479_009324 [Penicillium vulpinum]OQE05300.1 hypothetical protein PENVUL_c025G08063 [Penicillium vulpinum]